MKTRANFVIRKKRSPLMAIGGVAAVMIVGVEAWSLSRPVQIAPVVKPIAVIATAPASLALDQIEEVLGAISIPGLSSLEREATSHSLRITLDSDAYFETGRAKLKVKAISGLQQLVHQLKKSGAALATAGSIEIEGHTDNKPERKEKLHFLSNWGLSAARAAILVPFFAKAGFAKNRLSAIGYGDSRPVQTENNRRIVLRVTTGDEGGTR